MAYVKEGDTEIIHWVDNIVTTILLERTRGVIECAQNIVAEALRLKVVVGNTAEGIFSYMPAEEMMTVALINIGIGNSVQGAYKIRQRYKSLSARRLCECTHVMQGATRRGGEHGQPGDI